MNILIICSYYPPDSAVAAVRPYMFAKYLTLKGHQVAVLRSGAFYQRPDDSYGEMPEEIEVISFLGEDSDAERFRKGTYTAPGESSAGSNRSMAIPTWLRRPLSAGLKLLKAPQHAKRHKSKAARNFELQKLALDRISNRHFDIVFSTYSDLENLYAGEYAAGLFHAKWIADFRDAVVWYQEPLEYVWNRFAARVQREVLLKADVCTCVSEGLRESLKKDVPSANIYTLYNGYEDRGTSKVQENSGEQLVFCYTGQFYDLRVSALEAFADALLSIIARGDVQKDKLKFVYAGGDSDKVRRVFTERGILSILEDHAYVVREEAERLQNEADVFLVLSWNTKQSQGILTGKFYEGIKAGKPIISVLAGNLGYSELWQLNEKYGYGFCFEAVRKKELLDSFQNYLVRLYREKQENGRISYAASEDFKNAFVYNKTADALIKIAEGLLNENAG